MSNKKYITALASEPFMLTNSHGYVNKVHTLPVHKGDKIGRNEPCTCGSGKKYKQCCINK